MATAYARTRGRVYCLTIPLRRRGSRHPGMECGISAFYPFPVVLFVLSFVTVHLRKTGSSTFFLSERIAFHSFLRL